MSSSARRARILGAAGAALAVAGVIAIVVAVTAQQAAPQPPASAAIPIQVTPFTTPSRGSGTGTAPTTTAPTTAASTTAASTEGSTAGSATVASSPVPPAAPSTTRPANPASTAKPTVHGPILARSAPVHLSIPAIGVQSDLKTIGLTEDGEIETPPLVRDSHAYWLNVSPTPGQLGPSVILGHVDSAEWGPAVFFELGKLRQHDTISVTLADRTVAVFQVTHVNEYKKSGFPTMAVYGNTDHAALRLMTCGGTFNYAERSYESNIVVYAALISSHRA